MSVSPIDAIAALDPAQTESLTLAAQNKAHPPLAEGALALAAREELDELGSTPSLSSPGLSEALAAARQALQSGDVSAAEADLGAGHCELFRNAGPARFPIF